MGVGGVRNNVMYRDGGRGKRRFLYVYQEGVGEGL